jgi:anaerobic selenocysteine-containing dehydrogenase
MRGIKMNSKPIPKISRRGFLQTSATATALAALGGHFVNKDKKTLVPMEKGTNALASVWKRQYCSACIWPNCAMKVEVKDGVAIRLEGDPEAPFNKGTLCPRGAAQLANLYNPYRVKAPVKRTNPEKGLDVDPGWEEISWEEAFSTISEKLKDIRQTDPRKLVVKFGFSSQIHESRNPVITALSFGTPNSIMTAGPLCAVHYSPQLHHGAYVDKIDLGYCNYLISVGRTVGGNFMMANGPGRALSEALARGMKFVVIDPRCSPEAAKGEWVPIRPATDLAFGLAMLHVILHELNRYDVQAVKQRTNGPYLIGPDGDYVRHQESNKPLIWDLIDGMAKEFDDQSIQDFALAGSFELDGQTVHPALDLIKDHVEQYTPEWAEGITTIPADTIRRITTEFVDAARIGSTINIDGVEYPYRPVCLAAERGAVNHLQGRNFHFITGVINVLMGASDVPGSMCGVYEGPAWLQAGADGTVETGGALAYYNHGNAFSFPPNNIELKELYPISLGQPQVMARAVLDPEKYLLNYNVEAIMVHGANAIMNNANFEEVVESYKKIPFAFAVSYHFDEPTMMCDVVLPELSNLERHQIYYAHDIQAASSETINLHAVNYKYPVVDPVYDAKQVEDITFEIADRVGFLYGPGGVNFMWNMVGQIPETHYLALDKRYTYQEVCDIRLRAMFGEDKGEEFFKENGWQSWQIPLSQNYNYFHNPNTRLEIYARSLMDVGRNLKTNLDSVGVSVPGWDMDEFLHYYKAMPEWKDTFLFTAPDDFDLFVVNWKISPRNIGIGSQDDNPWLREVVEEWEHGGFSLQMNSATAEAKGLRNGDRVVVESQHGGKVEGTLFTSELLHPEIVGIPGQGGHYSMDMHPSARKGVHYNRLINSNEGHFCPSAGGIDITARVKVYKA